MSSQFDRVIQEFHQKRFDKEIHAQSVRLERLKELKDQAEIADQDMRKRRHRRYRA